MRTSKGEKKMQVIPLKTKYQLTEKDIDDLSRLMAEGCSLAHMAYFFQGRMTAEQLYIAAGILSKEMYEMPLAELCPHLIQERSEMNTGKGTEWQQQKREVNMLQLLKEVLEDLSLYEMELLSSTANRA
jgi:hypothetical protein